MEDDSDRPHQHVPRPPPPHPRKLPGLSSGTDAEDAQPPPSTAQAAQSSTAKHPLNRFSLRGSAHELEANAADTKPLLGQIVMDGQATMIYAAPNAGKTLITLHTVLEAIAAGRIAADRVLYVNADDGSQGLAVKVRLLEDVGAHMLAPGHKGMKTKDLIEKLRQSIEDGTARGTLVIIDTLKKFTDLMDKKRTSEFGQVCREYVSAGGTVLALGHTRKLPKANGSPQYQGTTDILEDFDAVYVGELVQEEGRTDRRVVRFTMEKKRADSPNEVAYAYVDEPGVSYVEKLVSLEPVDPDGLRAYRDPDKKGDVVQIRMAIADIIGDGFFDGKMALAAAAASVCKISKRQAIRVIEECTGTTPGVHIWNTETGAHNTQSYRLIIFD